MANNFGFNPKLAAGSPGWGDDNDTDPQPDDNGGGGDMDIGTPPPPPTGINPPPTTPPVTTGFQPKESHEDKRLEDLLTPNKKPSNAGLLHRYADFPAGAFQGLGNGFAFQTQSYNSRDVAGPEGTPGQSAWGHVPFGKLGANPLYYANPFYRPWFDLTAEGPGGFMPKDPFKKLE